MQFGGGQIIFPLAGRVESGAAQARSWLALILIQGRPLLTSGIFTGPDTIAEADDDEISPAVALNGNGMEIIASVTLGTALWSDAFWRLIQCGSGYYYLTVEDPRHAMASCVESPNSLYYFEPRDGLSFFADPDSFAVGAAAWYAGHTGHALARGLTIHLVAPSYIPHAGFTPPQPSDDLGKRPGPPP
jgi:hypothetical protein